MTCGYVLEHLPDARLGLREIGPGVGAGRAAAAADDRRQLFRRVHQPAVVLPDVQSPRALSHLRRAWTKVVQGDLVQSHAQALPGRRNLRRDRKAGLLSRSKQDQWACLAGILVARAVVLRALLVVLLCASLALAADPSHCGRRRTAAPPNVVIIFCDDLGYSDVGCFGAQGFETPAIDRLAQQGRRFTNFYVAQGVCTSSRAALLTGCYPNRIGLVGALWPKDQHRHQRPRTDARQRAQSRGYATAIVGKWHLGHHPQFLPTRHGFDEYFGIPYSNDMVPKAAAQCRFPNVPLFEGEKSIETGPDQSQLTRRYTERAVDFIDRKHEQPFFLYLAHTMPHMPLAAQRRFQRQIGRGLVRRRGDGDRLVGRADRGCA